MIHMIQELFGQTLSLLAAMSPAAVFEIVHALMPAHGKKRIGTVWNQP
jgi:hypothetical protein